MLVLRSSDASPFGRKVKIAAYQLGLMDRIEIAATDTVDPQDTIRSQNPLGKIPALILEDGFVVYDSPVIVEYLDYLAGGGKIIPTAPAERYPALVLQALADGVLDAALLVVYEKRWRGEEGRNAAWVDHQVGKIERGLSDLANAPLDGHGHVGHIATACALGYLDLRFSGSWRSQHPKLVEWLDEFSAKIPSFEKTRPKG